MTLCLPPGVCPCWGLSFPCQEHRLGTHTQSVVFAQLCITLYQRASPGAVCGVIAGLSDGCVSGSHLLVHETVFVLGSSVVRVLCHCVCVFHCICCVCVATCVGVYHVPGCVWVWFMASVPGDGARFTLLTVLLGIRVHVACGQPPSPGGTILGCVLCDAPK